MKRVLVAALAVALAGCSMVPDYEAPKTAAPAAFEYTGNAAAVWPEPDWWQGFGSAELTGLIEQARATSPDLEAGLARIAQAEAQSRSAASALYPSVSAGGGASRSTSVVETQGTVVRTSYQTDLSASYQLDLFGGNRAAAAAGRTRLEATQFDYEALALTLNADIAATYFDLLAVRDRIRLSNEQLGNAESILALLVQQQRIGVISDLELAQQRNAIAAQRASQQSLLQAERETEGALAVLVGQMPQGFDVQLRSLEALAVPGVVAGLPSELLQRRPDIRRAEADLRAGNFDVGSARAARFPSITLTASGGLASAALGSLLSPASLLTSLAAGLAAPIFEGGRLEAQEDAARARYRELMANYGKAMLSAFRDTDAALSGTDLYDRQYRLARESLAQANIAYRLAEARYRAGAVDFISVLDAQGAVFQASDSVAQANLARMAALVDLYEALGGGWDGSVRSASAAN